MLSVNSSAFSVYLLIPLALLVISLVQAQRSSQPKSKQQQTAAGGGQQFTTAPQCRCKDLEECAKEIEKLVNKCKLETKCEAHLKKIGNAQKIRQCLANEQKDMERLEECVEKRVGPIGCTNDEHPKNLTVPVTPEMEGARRRRRDVVSPTDWDFEDRWPARTRRSSVPGLPATQEAGHAPPELSDYLMCVDQCAVQNASPNSAPRLCATREGNMSCAFRLKCALMPPDERQQKAFDACESQLQLTAPKRLKKSCECLKAAGVKIVCPK